MNVLKIDIYELYKLYKLYTNFIIYKNKGIQDEFYCYNSKINYNYF